jgi:hypothetical protein
MREVIVCGVHYEDHLDGWMEWDGEVWVPARWELTPFLDRIWQLERAASRAEYSVREGG